MKNQVIILILSVAVSVLTAGISLLMALQKVFNPSPIEK